MTRKQFDYIFMALGLAIQVVTYFLSGSLSWLSLLSGCFGICSVCLTAQGNILTFAFGFAQVATYTWLCLLQRLYGGIALNAFYFVTMIYGVYIWRSRLSSDTGMVTPRQLKRGLMTLVVLVTLAASLLTGWALQAWTDDTQPYLDAFVTIPALVAQVLMMLVYSEHWLLWLAVDALSVVLWLRAGDGCMVAQYAFWTANCLYGLSRWRSSGVRNV